jgi:hypothetical protein
VNKSKVYLNYVNRFLHNTKNKTPQKQLIKTTSSMFYSRIDSSNLTKILHQINLFSLNQEAKMKCMIV